MTKKWFDRREVLFGGVGLATGVWAASGGLAAAGNPAALRSAIRGRVLLPGDVGFDAARTPWKLTVDQSVLAVAEIADADDAATLVRYARDAGLPIAVQPKGHGASGSLDATILVRTNLLDEVRVDPASGMARVGAGVSWDKVQAAAGPLGMTGVAGSSLGVGVTGYTVGGGLSWFSRKYGWASEWVSAFEVVDANGEQRRVAADADPDLFWALRGGGGDYALVTSVEFGLKPTAAVFGGRMLWPATQARDVFAAYQAAISVAPDELSLWLDITQILSAPATISVDMTYLGTVDAGRELMRPFDGIAERISDSRRMMLVTEVGSIADEPLTPTPIRLGATLATGFTDMFIDQLLTQSDDVPVMVQIRHLGGALAQPSDTPAGTVTAPYLIQFAAIQTDPPSADMIESRIGEFLDTLAPVSAGRILYNFLDRAQTVADVFDAPTLARLRAVKTSRDPDNIFRSNYPILAS